jgi:hypothetical protein
MDVVAGDDDRDMARSLLCIVDQPMLSPPPVGDFVKLAAWSRGNATTR